MSLQRLFFKIRNSNTFFARYFLNDALNKSNYMALYFFFFFKRSFDLFFIILKLFFIFIIIVQTSVIK